MVSSMPFKNRPSEMTDEGHPNTSTTNAGKVDSCRIDQREIMTNSHASPVSGELTFCVTFHYQSTMTSLTNCPFLRQISDSSRPLLAAFVSPSTCPPKTVQTNLSSNTAVIDVKRKTSTTHSSRKLSPQIIPMAIPR